MARRPDPVRLDVFHHLFASIGEEMGATLMRSAFSPNIRERRDFSCALFDRQGRMIGQASHLPVHLGSTPMSVAAAIEHVTMERGDAVLLNDPYAGGTHLPDLTLVSPVFLSRRGGPDFYVANPAPHADVGGASPGSMAPQADVHGEGLRIPPVRIVRGGELDPAVMALVLANMRVPMEREADLLAQWSTNKVGERRLRELADEQGRAQVEARAGELMDWTERLTRALLAELPDGEWSFEDQLEGADGLLRLRLRIEGDRASFDFRASDARPGCALNTTRAVTLSAVFYVLRTLLPADTPSNDGVLRPVEVWTQPGTLVDARYPSGVAAGNVETSQRLVDVLLGALARVAPERVPAASAGTMSNLTFGGGGPETARDAFVYYETLGGGAGAGPEGPGAHALQTHMTNTRNTPIEAFEATYPVRVRALGVRRGSGGTGRHAGGDGLEKELEFLEPVQVAWVAERQRTGPWGLAGGADGAAGGAFVREPGEARWRPFAELAGEGSGSRQLPAGTRMRLATPGGGGYGTPD